MRSALAGLLSWLLLSVLAAVPNGSGKAGAAESQPGPPPVPQLVPENPGPHGYFEFGTPAGQTVSGTVTVVNPSSNPATFDIYPTDATTASLTGVQYSSLGQPLHGTGEWLHVAAASVPLDPGQSRTVGFTLTVPQGTTAGDHIAGIAAENPSSAKSHGGQSPGTQASIVTRVVVAVVVHVPGSASVSFHLGTPSIAAASGGRSVVVVPVSDTGSLLSKPFLNSNIRRCGSPQPLASLGRQLDTFVPQTTVFYQWPLRRHLGPGCYEVTASIYSGSSLLSQVSTTATTAAEGVKKGSAEGPSSGRSGDPPSWIVALDSALLLSVGVGGAGVLAGRRRQVRR